MVCSSYKKIVRFLSLDVLGAVCVLEKYKKKNVENPLSEPLLILTGITKFEEQQSPMGILTGRSDPPHLLVSQMLARSCISTNRRDEKCDCVTHILTIALLNDVMFKL